MNRSIILTFFLLYVSSSTIAQQNAAGDSARIVILSDRVGPVISAAGRDTYHVFTQFQGFRQAVVVQFPDSSYAIRVTLVSAGEPRDTLVRYSATTIMMMAEKIEHFEELESGKYVWGSIPPVLKYASGGVSMPRAFVPPSVTGPEGAELSMRKAKPQTADSSRPNRRISPSHYGFESLPLARASGQIMPRYYPSLAFAFGIRSYAPDFSGLASATGVVPRMDISPIIDILPELLITEEIGIQADAGFSPGDKCYVAALSLVLYAHPFDNPGWRPFIQGGYVWTSIGGDLGGIDFVAGGGGLLVGAGIEFLLGSTVGIALDVCYDRIAKKSTFFSDWMRQGEIPAPVSIDLSSVQFGIRLKLQ